MKRLLFITPFSPDNQGPGVSYTSQLIKELAKNHCIDLVYFCYKNDRMYAPPTPQVNVILVKRISLVNKIIGFIVNPRFFPLFTSRYDKSVCKFLNNRIKEVSYDVVYFDFSQTFSYARILNHPNKVLMSHDVIAQKYSRMKSYLRPWAMASEKILLKGGTIIFTFSQKDCNLLNSLYGVDSMYTTFFLNENVLKAVPVVCDDYFVFFGAWNRAENTEGLIWFLDYVYDYIPVSLKFIIIGGGLPEHVKYRILTKSNIEYLGFVENPYPIIANAKAEIAALHMGAGVKVKCIEALASGTPIIGTEVAFEGIDDEFSPYMILANTSDEYIKNIVNYRFTLEDKIYLKRYFVERYDNKNILNYINK